ncbi:hypothetical protein U2F26_06325 [Micromonospora sp. 4G57]|uniref:Uncharacterized protein n=1 Tax=Micromonospora sicca TaxID=2202420 RepID=A0ABU5J989_9ACTN|nr:MULTISPECIES: hypothetical protein [unclassified Micromonospora]MDZ5442348.1 hypothetical protein [Micromonospora sp. 4G57]MDZ5489153.1 hypothetical protein [Micromonospora sp. 4G53]
MSTVQTHCPTALFDGAEALADAILYEGYLLYPYRRSSVKNRVRWQFGVLVPPAWGEAHGLVDSSVAGSAESSWQQTECLMEAQDTAIVRIRLRFLHLQRKVTELRTTDGGYRPVDRIEVGGRTELSFDEAVPREFDIEAPVGDLRPGRRFHVCVPGGEDVEPLVDDRGEPLGRVVRRRWPLSASVAVSAVPSPAPFRLLRLAVRVENTDRTTPADGPRDEALRCCLLAAHTLATVSRGRFLSLLDPPEWAAQAARECSNVHTFPVLAGAPGTADVVLSAPIILYDHPRIAPESPGDLHDATEIDEILSLRTLTLSDAEKREARATDPRAAAILDRVDAMPPEVLERLHGAIRSLEPVHQPGDSATGLERARSGFGTDVGITPATETVLVAGTLLSRGSRVRLRPRRRGTDAHDMFLEGRTGRVEQVLLDIDGTRFLAVTVDDDPGAELHQWYGRLRHFRPEEVEPLPGEVEAR